MKFAKTELRKYKISEVCNLLGVSRSEYYRDPARTDNEENEIEQAVINCFKKHKRNYGRVRIRKELLTEKGLTVSEYRISRILKKNGLVAKSGRTGKPKRPKPT